MNQIYSGRLSLSFSNICFCFCFSGLPTFSMGREQKQHATLEESIKWLHVLWQTLFPLPLGLNYVKQSKKPMV